MLLLHTTVGIGYEEPQKKVERLLIEAAVETAGVKEKPGLFVLRTALGSHDVAYEINVYMLKDFKPLESTPSFMRISSTTSTAREFRS